MTSGGAAPAPDAGDTAADGGANEGDAGAAIPDAAPDVDHGQPSTTYPAFKPDVAQLVNNGGAVLKNPVIVTVTWPGDPGAAEFERFGDQIGATEYWAAVTKEYGVEQASSGAPNHVRIATPAPAMMSDQDLDTFVATNAGAPATSQWPAPTDQTIYVLYLHPSTSLQLNGQDACQAGIGGYHMSTQVNGMDVAYAIIPSCARGSSSAFDESTASASHELAEAATDPHPETAPAWVGFDDNHLAYELWQQFNSENADSCEFFRESFYKAPAPFGFQVQRSWSNKAIAEGHHPCLPAPDGAFFNATLLSPEAVTVDLSRIGGSANVKTTGVRIKVGETRTFPVGLFSDGPTSGPWSIRATEGNPVFGAPKTSRLTVSVDKTSGQNGEIAYVTVTVKSAGTTKSELVSIVSSMGGATHYAPILIGSSP